MTILPTPDRAPEAMTNRARVYLIIGGLRHLGIGIFMLGWPGQFTAAAFIPIVGSFPLWFWAAAFLAAALICLTGSGLRSRPWARAGLIASAATTAACAAGLWIGIISLWAMGKPATPVATILLTSLTLKDLVMCSWPMRTPFEEVLLEFADRLTRTDGGSPLGGRT